MIDRRAFISRVALGILLAPLAAGAQPPTKIPRVGLLLFGSPSDSATRFVEAFRQGLRELGYVEGQNIAIEDRHAEGREHRLPDLAADLVRLKVDVIVAVGRLAASVARNATKTIPIVMGSTSDPVGSGLVASLARPGGNLTGLSILASELSGKRLELLKEMVPRISRVAVLAYPANPALALQLRETQVAARTLGLQLQILEVRSPDDLDRAFGAAKKERAGALNILPSAFYAAHRKKLVDLAAESRLPAMYDSREYVEAGGLMAYGPNLSDLYRRAAGYVDKILKGAKPADLPVEQPTKFELVINLKTAKALGLTIPPSLMLQADEVIQ
jgi:putative ABC transport system substrate-binding protein